jgi:hypothetical protein
MILRSLLMIDLPASVGPERCWDELRAALSVLGSFGGRVRSRLAMPAPPRHRNCVEMRMGRKIKHVELTCPVSSGQF